MTTMLSVSCRRAVIMAAFFMAAIGGEAAAQPTFGNPSPTAGSTTSQQANAAADAAAYKEVDYVNKGTKGPALDASLTQLRALWAETEGVT